MVLKCKEKIAITVKRPLHSHIHSDMFALAVHAFFILKNFLNKKTEGEHVAVGR